jgi:hypothetical protein
MSGRVLLGSDKPVSVAMTLAAGTNELLNSKVGVVAALRN